MRNDACAMLRSQGALIDGAVDTANGHAESIYHPRAVDGPTAALRATS